MGCSKMDGDEKDRRLRSNVRTLPDGQSIQVREVQSLKVLRGHSRHTKSDSVGGSTSPPTKIMGETLFARLNQRGIVPRGGLCAVMTSSSVSHPVCDVTNSKIQF